MNSIHCQRRSPTVSEVPCLLFSSCIVVGAELGEGNSTAVGTGGGEQHCGRNADDDDGEDDDDDDDDDDMTTRTISTMI